jgi:hypothetical protein
MKYGREDEERRDGGEKRERCGTKQREGGKLVMKEREGGAGRWGREEAEIRE